MGHKKSIFFAGNPFGSGGPSEVNKSYVRHLHGRVSHLTISNPIGQFLEIFLKLLLCRVIIFSSIRNVDHLLLPLCRVMRKRILYIMHGCLAYENKTNHIFNTRGERNELIMLRDAHKILCVSDAYRHWVAERYPQYASKSATLTNGVNWEMLSSGSCSQLRDKHRIILIGGNLFMKHNLEVCRAVEMLNDKEEGNYHIDIYGPYYANDDSEVFSKKPYVTWHGTVSHEELLLAMRGAALFVQNSDLESFGLGIIEALVCGCNILVSQNVGAIDIMLGITEDDIIRNPLDIQEIAEKIQKVMQVSNNERLFSSIDREATSTQAAAERLYQIALQQNP